MCAALQPALSKVENSMKNSVEIVNLDLEFGSVKVLQDLNLEIRTLPGPNPQNEASVWSFSPTRFTRR